MESCPVCMSTTVYLMQIRWKGLRWDCLKYCFEVSSQTFELLCCEWESSPQVHSTINITKILVVRQSSEHLQMVWEKKPFEWDVEQIQTRSLFVDSSNWALKPASNGILRAVNKRPPHRSNHTAINTDANQLLRGA